MDEKEREAREKFATWLHRHMDTMTVEPGEVLVLSTEHHLSAEQSHRISTDLHTIFGAETKILVLDGGMKIGKLKPVAPVEEEKGPTFNDDFTYIEDPPAPDWARNRSDERNNGERPDAPS